jgi:nicotinamidase-related amidase
LLKQCATHSTTLVLIDRHGYELMIAEDMCSTYSAEMHQFAFDHIFPRIARVRGTSEILAAL